MSEPRRQTSWKRAPRAATEPRQQAERSAGSSTKAKERTRWCCQAVASACLDHGQREHVSSEQKVESLAQPLAGNMGYACTSPRCPLLSQLSRLIDLPTDNARLVPCDFKHVVVATPPLHPTRTPRMRAGSARQTYI